MRKKQKNNKIANQDQMLNGIRSTSIKTEPQDIAIVLAPL